MEKDSSMPYSFTVKASPYRPALSLVCASGIQYTLLRE
jgi:hypothetical protein